MTKRFKIDVKYEYRASEKNLVTFINPYSALILAKHPNINLTLFDIYVDGILICLLENKIKGLSIDRVSFDYTSIAKEVFKSAQLNSNTITLIGSKDGVTSKAKSLIEQEFPSIQIVNVFDGYFDSESSRNKMIINCLDSDIVVCGMGTPHQEAFLQSLLEKGFIGKAYTCGGFFDQLVSGNGDYYPEWINKHELRWAYRILKEPTRLWKRYLVDYITFMYKYATKQISINKAK